MKKTLFTLVALVATMSMSAQVTRLYKNGNLVAAFNKSQVDEIVFDELEQNDAVDLGLSVKWAVHNVGAKNPEDAGNYYAWGESIPQASNVYDWSTYKWCNGSHNSFTRYCTNAAYGLVDNTTSLIYGDDAALLNLDGLWRMPSKDEMQELIDNCIWTWTSKNGTSGYKVTAKNGNSIFLPVTGTRYQGNLNSADWLGTYWTSDLYGKSNDYANYLSFSENGHGVAFMMRCMGMAIRPVYDKHEYVDLGLSVKWATCNVGASSPEGYGDYFAWGETTPQPTNSYSWDSYKWWNASNETMTKYCIDSKHGTVDNNTTLELADDAANVNWKGYWRMPTKAEQIELFQKCTWTWTTQGNVSGFKVTGPNGNYIFLPAAGQRAYGEAADGGFYWSSSLGSYTDTDYASYNAYVLYFFSDSSLALDSTQRDAGFSVRPVYP